MAPATAPAPRRLLPPPARRTTDVATLHGIELPDPYRWLEDSASAETRRWVDQQNEATYAFLAGLRPKEAIVRRLETLSSYEQISVPIVRGGRHLFLRTDRSSNQASLVSARVIGGAETTILDADQLDPAGRMAITDFVVSDDGRLVAVGLSIGGSDMREWHVYDVERRTPTGDRIRWMRAARPSWSADGRGFYYAGWSERDPPERRERALGQRIFYHRLGTDQLADEVVLELESEPEWRPQPLVVSEGRLLVVTISHGVGSGNRVLVRRLGQRGAEPITLADSFDDDFVFVAARHDVLWFLTTSGAARGHVVAIDVRRPERRNWSIVLPEQSDVLQSVVQVRRGFVAATLHDAVSRLSVHDELGSLLGQVELPEAGTVRTLRATRNGDDVYFAFASFRTPPTVYRLDTRSRTITTVHRPQVAFRPDEIRTEQIFVPARDGTPLPVFLTARHDVSLRGAQPTFLTAYGGFGLATTPSFSPGQILWLELGGIVATAVVRGGGEYGRTWHEQGRRRRKLTTIDDFIQVADWLVREHVTTAARLGIGGGSNGALLVSAAMVRRPDLAAAVLADVGLYDMMRFHRLGVGWQWIDEYGSPDWLDDFEVLRQYSPYHNVQAGTAYPATLVTTNDGDDRVAPAHSFKLVAALQAAQAGPAPIFLRLASGSGHAEGTARRQRVQGSLARWLFLAQALGVDRSVWGADEPLASPSGPCSTASSATDGAEGAAQGGPDSPPGNATPDDKGRPDDPMAPELPLPLDPSESSPGPAPLEGEELTMPSPGPLD